MVEQAGSVCRGSHQVPAGVWCGRGASWSEARKRRIDRLILYLGLGLGLGLLVADTSYAPRGILDIEKRESRMSGCSNATWRVRP